MSFSKKPLPNRPFDYPSECPVEGCGAPVKSHGTFHTDIGWNRYEHRHDPHRHDPNRHTWMGSCEKGHKLIARGYAACPVEECRYGEKETWELGWKDGDG